MYEDIISGERDVLEARDKAVRLSAIKSSVNLTINRVRKAEMSSCCSLSFFKSKVDDIKKSIGDKIPLPLSMF